VKYSFEFLIQLDEHNPAMPPLPLVETPLPCTVRTTQPSISQLAKLSDVVVQCVCSCRLVSLRCSDLRVAPSRVTSTASAAGWKSRTSSPTSSGHRCQAPVPASGEMTGCLRSMSTPLDVSWAASMSSSSDCFSGTASVWCSPTLAVTIAYHLWFYFPLIFSFLSRALD